MSEDRGRYNSGLIYNVLSPYGYTTASGEQKVGWTEVGVAFEAKNGQGLNIEIRPHLSISGRLVVRPRRNGDAGAAGTNNDIGSPASGPTQPGRFVHDFDADELI